MSIAILIPGRDNSALKARLEALLPAGVPVHIFPDTGDPAPVKMAVVWKHPYGSLAQFPNLKLIQSYGAGVEHLLLDPHLPAGVPVCRIVEEQLTLSMRNYIGMAVLMIHKRMDFYLQRQREKTWAQPEPVELPLRIGVLGMGVLGTDAARFLAGMGFEVWGYSQSKKAVEGVVCLNPKEASLHDFAGMVNVLVCLLPLTPQTQGVLNEALFQRMPWGSYVINAARGGHLAEVDLLRALDSGQLAGAFLDVFQEEPLPPEHPFWVHPQIFITPHSASVTNADGAARLAAENYRRLKAGEGLLHEVLPAKGY